MAIFVGVIIDYYLDLVDGLVKIVLLLVASIFLPLSQVKNSDPPENGS